MALSASSQCLNNWLALPCSKKDVPKNIRGSFGLLGYETNKEMGKQYRCRRCPNLWELLASTYRGGRCNLKVLSDRYQATNPKIYSRTPEEDTSGRPASTTNAFVHHTIPCLQERITTSAKLGNLVEIPPAKKTSRMVSHSRLTLFDVKSICRLPCHVRFPQWSGRCDKNKQNVAR